jgi:hypothetical protein
VKKLLPLIFVTLLTGCATQGVPVVPKWPDVPPDLMVSCPDLAKMDPEQVKELSQVLKNVTANYGEYHNCQAKINNWIEWYNSQQKIFKEIK